MGFSETDPARTIAALFVGGLVGGMLTSASLAVMAAVPFLVTGQLDSVVAALAVGLMVSPFSLVVWMAGVLLVGAPFWAALHALNIRSPQAGALLGATLAFAVTVGSVLLLTSNEGMSGLWLSAAGLAIIGAIAGWAAALTAYGQGAPR